MALKRARGELSDQQIDKDLGKEQIERVVIAIELIAQALVDIEVRMK
jgi:hypothetical protein